MPRGDRMGPAGTGSMMGRAAGYCAGYPVPGFMNNGVGRGYWGRGGGRGWRHLYRATGLPGRARAGYPVWDGPAAPFAPAMTAEQELEGLKNQAEYLQDALSQINNRIRQLETESNK